MSHYPRHLYSFPEPTWWNGTPSKWTDDPYYFEPRCARCDDAGCEECCPTSPATLDDLEQLEWEMQEAERLAEERKRLENEAMAEHFRKHPHG